MKNEKTKTISELNEKIQALEKSGAEMGTEISSLKSQIGGYKSSNAAYRKRIKTLEQQLEDARAYGAEADQMYDEKLTLLDEFHKNMAKLEEKIDDLSKQLTDAKVEAKTAKETLETYTKSSWLKRMLMKI